jgi:predicted ATP-dependent endonuclease of OLD family
VIVRNILVRNYLALRDVRINFHDELQYLIGINGSGKTTLLRLLAGIAGTDQATTLVANHPIGEIELSVEDEGSIKTFYVTDKLTPKAIYKFKDSLSRRVSWPITTSGNAFVSECDPNATDKARLARIFEGIWGENLKDNLLFTSTSDHTHLMVGKGFARAMSLITLDSPDGVPMLLDLPESHLDMTAKRCLMDLLAREERQLIIATHSPEVLASRKSNHAIYDVGEQSALDA